MQDWLKLLLAVGGGAAVALIIALPIVLTDSSSDADDQGTAQRFPKEDFVKFDEIWDGTLSYNSFGYSFSHVNPDHYICTSSDETTKDHVFKTPISNYTDGGSCYFDGLSVPVAGANFVSWKDINHMESYTISPDEQYVLARKNYQKQWRHSFYSDYYVYDLVADKEVENADIRKFPQAQYASWSPSGHRLIWVSNNKDIYYQTGDDFATDAIRVTDDGGWCIDNPRILGTVYPNLSASCMYNGVPEWNNEEEMVGSTNTIYWSPDSNNFVFVAFDVTDVPLLEYSVYPDHMASSSPDESDPQAFEQYPRINSIKYAKSLGEIAKTKLYLVTGVNTPNFNKKELNKVGDADNLKFDIGVGQDDDQENRYFTRIGWARNSDWFAMTWTSRAGTQSKTLTCKVADQSCIQNGREDGGVKGNWKENGDWEDIDDDSNNYGGWVGSFGPFSPIPTQQFPNYFTVYSYKLEDAPDGDLHPYGLKIKDGFWNAALQSQQQKDEHLSGATWLTDSRSNRWTVSELNFYDETNDFLYFTAARSTKVGSDETTEQRKRQVFRVKQGAMNDQEPECITCSLDSSDNNVSFGHCGTVSIRRNCDECPEMVFIATCRGSGGHAVPQVYRSKPTQNFLDNIEWEIMESNTELTGKLATKSNVNTEYNVWNNEVYKTAHNYEVYSPSTLDTSGNKKYALFLEVYAGPEFQKISETFKRSWPQIHLPAAYDCITVSVDGRGSAFQGDRFMFSNYRALGQTERVDQTDFVRWFMTEGPYASIIDQNRVSIYGWSYGGYTTTHTIAYGGGGEPVFTSGVAVAPLADWRYYDAMYAERYMDYTGVENEELQMHWVNASMIERPINENDMTYFRNTSYNLIHGTNDDNVHFISAAQMEKALVSRGIDFDNFFYADEDHSIRTTQTVQKHIYRNIISRIVKSWGYVWNGDGHGCGTCF